MAERGPRQGRKIHHESQMSFLTPDEAYMVHLMRRFLAEASRIYEARTGKGIEEALQVRSPQDAYEFLRLEMESLEQEQLRTITLNTKNRIISAPMIYQGSVHTTVVRIGEVFRPAIRDNATSIIVCHNHPSGTADQSPEDVALTTQLVKAGELLDIPVLDHIIIGRGKPGFVSLKERGLFPGR
jgi:DNA repair protein RadC